MIKKIFMFILYFFVAIFLFAFIADMNIGSYFVSSDTSVSSIKEEVGFSNRQEFYDHCTYKSYIHSNCVDLRFIYVHKFLMSDTCTDDNILCNEYYRSGDYYSDYEIVKNKCLDVPVDIASKECLAYFEIDKRFFK